METLLKWAFVICVVLLVSYALYAFEIGTGLIGTQEPYKHKPQPAEPMRIGPITMQKVPSVPATITPEGRLMVRINEYSGDALLDCDSVHHKWVERAFTLSKDQPDLYLQHCKQCGVLRSTLIAVSEQNAAISSADVYVGGATAVIFDLANDLNEQFRVMEIVVVIGIFLVLLIVLGAVLLSLFAIISILPSISWAFAATVGVFGYALGEPILWIIPLILFIMLMGIGMDYNVFILTRIREERHKGRTNSDAIVESLDWTGEIITALAIIMGSAISMMMISSTTMLKEMGFAIAFAIMLDAMFVRTYIVPAMMTILGERAWWAPGPLQREGRRK